jgi:hypothetical protein
VGHIKVIDLPDNWITLAFELDTPFPHAVPSPSILCSGKDPLAVLEGGSQKVLLTPGADDEGERVAKTLVIPGMPEVAWAGSVERLNFF